MGPQRWANSDPVATVLRQPDGRGIIARVRLFAGEEILVHAGKQCF